MSKEIDTKARLLQSIICFVRDNHAEDIDKAYAYFWDESEPDEFLSGTALELGFINFEDWLLFDYRINSEKQTFLDLYATKNKDLEKDGRTVINKIKDSVLSFYEVTSASKDKKVIIKDLLLDEEISLRDKYLTRGLNKGDLFATRVLNLDGNHVMSNCVYPYSCGHKKKVLSFIENQFGRYKRNVNREGTMRDFLKDYGDVFNIIWMQCITEPPEKNKQPV